MKNICYVKNIAIISSLIPCICLAEDDHYISAQAGASMLNNKVGMSFEDLQSGPYSKHTLKNTASFSVISGKRMYHNLFGELEYAYTDGYKLKFNDMALPSQTPISFNGKIRSHNIFTNLNYRFKEVNMQFAPYAITPYVLVGAGLAINQVNQLKYTLTLPTLQHSDKISNASSKSFAWQLGAGIIVPYKDKIEFNISYKYKNLGRVKSGISGNVRPIKSHISSSNLMVGVAYKF